MSIGQLISQQIQNEEFKDKTLKKRQKKQRQLIKNVFDAPKNIFQSNDNENHNTASQLNTDDNNEQKELFQGDENPLEQANLSAAQLNDRLKRTIFIGNVPLTANKKQVMRMFCKYGTIEKLWVRSMPIEQSKLPIKAAVALKQLKDDATSYNCYILFKDEESTVKALDSNGCQINSHHIRVDLAKKNDDNDFSIFIGNLAYNTKEESLRQHFERCGVITNVRVIRDASTHIGKGFGYVTFKDKISLQNALQLNGQKFNERELRIKKAVRAERLEKKARKQKEKTKHFALGRIQGEKKPQQEHRQNKDYQNGDHQSKVQKINNEALLKFVKLNEQNEIDPDSLDFKNRITTGKQHVIRKQIKKQEKKGGSKDVLKITQQESLRIEKQHDKNIFNCTYGLKERREDRLKKQLHNIRKYKDTMKVVQKHDKDKSRQESRLTKDKK